MKKFLILLFILLFLCIKADCTELPKDLKTFLKSKYPNIVFKIDNSFTIGNDLFLPLMPPITKQTKKIDIVYFIPDKINKTAPKLLLLSNDWIFVKVIKETGGSQTIIDLTEISEKYKEQFLKTRFPNDLVVPKEFAVKEELSGLVGEELPIKIKKQENKVSANLAPINSDGILYLTSPDTGKVVYLNLNDLSMVFSVQTNGAPWEIAFDKTNKILFVSDFAKDQILELQPLDTSILTSVQLVSMSSPRDIEVSEDGSVIYVLESLGNDLGIYKANETKPFIKTKLPTNPTNFSLIKEAALIAVTCPSINRLVLIDLNNFSIINQIMIEGGPEKVIASTNGKTLYITNRNENTVSVFDINSKKLTGTIQVGEIPTSLVLHSNGKLLYVSNGKSNTISIINLETNQVTDTITLPIETQFPGDIKLTPNENYLIVTSETTNTISIVNLALKKVAVKLDVGATTHAAFLYNTK